MSQNYLLVTAAKNEYQRLPFLIESVVEQTILPVLWVLVDDGSTDDTSNLMETTANQYAWARVIHRDEGPHHGLRYASALREGFDWAQRWCAKYNIAYQYLGLIDADMMLEPDHFEKMMANFEQNPRLGLACCGFYHLDDEGNPVLEAYRKDWPRGGARFWRRECYEQMGGQPVAKSADSVGNVKVKYAGWEMYNFPDIKALTRKSGSTKGHWAHCVYAAETAYYLHYNPLLVVMKALFYLWRSPHYGIVPFSIIYLKEWLVRHPRYSDPEVKDYYGRQRVWEYWRYLKAHLLTNKSTIEIQWDNDKVDPANKPG